MEQAGLRKNPSCSDQILSLINFIEFGFRPKLGFLFIDLAAAYRYIVWSFSFLKNPHDHLGHPERLFNVFLNYKLVEAGS